MRFTISREALQKALGAATTCVPSRSTLPVLGNVLVETQHSAGIQLACTDLDTRICVEATAEIEAQGRITVPASKLNEIARQLPAAPVRISATGLTMTIEAGKTRFKLAGIGADEFPVAPAIAPEGAWKVPAADLLRMIHHASFATSSEESRPILHGVAWEIEPECMRMVATDGHRLAKVDLPMSSATTASLIVPGGALAHISKLLPNDGEVEIARSENQIRFQAGGISIFSRLIEGPYPSYEQVLPSDNDRIAIIDKAALSGALRRASILADTATRKIKLEFGGELVPDAIRFCTQSPDQGESQEDVPAKYDGPQFDIGFNAAYLIEALKYIPTDDVRMTFKTPERAATIEPVGWDSQTRLLYLVMPLRLNA